MLILCKGGKYYQRGQVQCKVPGRLILAVNNYVFRGTSAGNDSGLVDKWEQHVS